MDYTNTKLVEVDKIYDDTVRVIWGYFDDNTKLDNVDKIDDSYDPVYGESSSDSISIDQFETPPEESNVYRVKSEFVEEFGIKEDAEFIHSPDEESAVKKWNELNLP